MREGRGRDRGRHRIRSSLQALSCQHRARRGARTHRPRDHDPTRSWPLNRQSHPGAEQERFGGSLYTGQTRVPKRASYRVAQQHSALRASRQDTGSGRKAVFSESVAYCTRMGQDAGISAQREAPPPPAKLLRGEWGRRREDRRTRPLPESTRVKTGYRSPGTSQMASETGKLHATGPTDRQGEGRAGRRQSRLPGF